MMEFKVNGFEVMGVIDRWDDGTEFSVLGREKGEDYWCTWIGNVNGCGSGHYRMTKERAIQDWLERAGGEYRQFSGEN